MIVNVNYRTQTTIKFLYNGKAIPNRCSALSSPLSNQLLLKANIIYLINILISELMKAVKKRKDNTSQAVKRVKEEDNQEDSDSSIDPKVCEIDKEDLIIWPIEDVERNFKRFLAETGHLDYRQTSMLELVVETVPPNNRELQEIFDFSLQKIQGRQNKKKWKDNEKQLLQWVIFRYCLQEHRSPGQLSDADWRRVSQLIIGRNATQCKYKWLAKSKFKLVQVPWTTDEDEALVFVYNVSDYRKKGKQNKWSDMAKEIALRCKTTIVRQGKQCRERWINKLDPQISKGPWSKEEELKILKLIILKGKKWSEISKLLQNSRTENSLKNRYHTLMKKEKNRPCNMDLDKNDVSDLIERLKVQHNLANPAHLYEDIDASELQIILQLITTLEEQTGLYNLEIKEEMPSEPDPVLEVEPKAKSDETRKKFLEEFDIQRMKLEQSVEPAASKDRLKVPTNPVNDQKMIKVIQSMLSRRPQDLEIDFKKIDQDFHSCVDKLGAKECTFEVETVQNIKLEDIEDLHFALVDATSNVAYMIPTEQFSAVADRLKHNQGKANDTVSEPQLNHSSMSAARNSSEQASSSQYLLQQPPLNCVMYPQFMYNPMGASLQYSAGHQPFLPNLMVLSNYPMYMANSIPEGMDLEMKQEAQYPGMMHHVGLGPRASMRSEVEQSKMMFSTPIEQPQQDK